MEYMRESLFASGLRSFINALLAMVGILIGLFILIMGVASASKPFANTPTNQLVMDILPDADGHNDLLPETAPAILQLDIKGVIGSEQLCGQMNDTILLASRQGLLKNDRVKAIILYIDSPGGTVVDSDMIHRALLAYKEKYKTPIYAYVNGIAASGGYMIACAAEQINSSPVGIIGSVGVKLGPAFNYYGLLQKLGVQSITLTDGHYKEPIPAFEPWPADMKAKNGVKSYQDLLNIVSAMYDRFVSIVISARAEHSKLTEKDLRDFHGAQVYLAATAQDLGFIDSGSSNYNDTLRDLVKVAGIADGTRYQVVRFSPTKFPFKDLLSCQVNLWTRKIQSELLGMPAEEEWKNQFLYHFSATGK